MCLNWKKTRIFNAFFHVGYMNLNSAALKRKWTVYNSKNITLQVSKIVFQSNVFVLFLESINDTRERHGKAASQDEEKGHVQRVTESSQYGSYYFPQQATIE